MPRAARACWDGVLRILDEVAAGAISDAEVSLAKRSLAAGVTLGAEGAEAMMDAIAGEYLARGRRFDAARVRAELAQVSPERVRALAAKVARLDLLAGAVCGPWQALELPAGIEQRVA